MVSVGANRHYTLLKGDLEVVAAKGNLIIPRLNSATGCSFMSYPGRVEFNRILLVFEWVFFDELYYNQSPGYY